LLATPVDSGKTSGGLHGRLMERSWQLWRPHQTSWLLPVPEVNSGSMSSSKVRPSTRLFEHFINIEFVFLNPDAKNEGVDSFHLLALI
jgi:hypothetical protein